MKVLFHCWEYPPRGSGIGRYIYHMSRALREAGHYTVVVTSHGVNGPTEECLHNGMVYRDYDVQDIGKPHIAKLILQKACEHHVDWIEGADHLGESAVILKNASRPPVIIKCHYNDALRTLRYSQAYYPWQKFTIATACLRKRRRIADERYSIEHADVLITPCQKIMDEIRGERLHVPVQTAVIPNPFCLPDSYANQEAVVPTILVVGRIDIGKGIQYLPDALAKIVMEYPDVRLEMAGEDGYARGIGSMRKWLIGRYGSLAGNLHFLGQLDNDGINEAYRRAWVVIVPSRWDTFPTVVLEAMARGKAIVASRNGGMPEMLEGTLCPVADPESEAFSTAITELLSRKDKRILAGESGRQKLAREYSPRRIAEQYVDVLRQIMP